MFNFAIEFDKWHTALRRQQFAERRLAASTQTDERDALSLVLAERKAETLLQQFTRLFQSGRRKPFEKLRHQQSLDRTIRPVVDQLFNRQAERAHNPTQKYN